MRFAEHLLLSFLKLPLIQVLIFGASIGMSTLVLSLVSLQFLFPN